MPRGDRTGPMGLGPMTGGAAGYCAGFPIPGYVSPVGLWRRLWPVVKFGLGIGRDLRRDLGMSGRERVGARDPARWW